MSEQAVKSDHTKAVFQYSLLSPFQISSQKSIPDYGSNCLKKNLGSCTSHFDVPVAVQPATSVSGDEKQMAPEMETMVSIGKRPKLDAVMKKVHLER